MSFSRGLTGILALTFTALVGCGSPPPPPPSASKDIESARMALDSARSMEKMGQLDAALANYRRAKEAVAKGKEIAEGSELSQLEGMEEEARKQINVLEIKKINIASQPEKPKTVAIAPTKSEDPEEKKKREADAIEAKRKADAAKTQGKLDETFKTGVTVGKPKDKPTEEDEPAAKVATKKEGDNADGKEEGEAAAAPKAKAIKEAKGPYPAVTEQSPEMEIVKLTIKGKFALTYFQVYNKKENGRRIMNQAIYFKNGNGQECIPSQSVQVYPYNGFKADTADPSNQQIDGLTVGSNQITGGESGQFVAVGTSDNASQVKSVGVIMVFDDGTKLTASGPAGGVDLNAGGGVGTIKGLKAK